MYDVLQLTSPNGSTVMLNRRGTVQVSTPIEHTVAMTWEDVLTTDMRRTVDRLTQLADLPPVSNTPPSTPPVLVYRVISALASMRLFAEPIMVQSGTHEDKEDGLLDNYPAIKARVPDSLNEPSLEFWHVAFSGFRAILETEAGNMWAPHSANPVPLSSAYREQNRNMTKLVAHVLQIGSR